MHTFNDVHQQFAAFFKSDTLQPFAYLVSKKLAEGHICVRLDDLADEITDLPQHYKNISERRDALKEEPLVAAAPGYRQPFVLHNGSLYLQRYFEYETLILNRIRGLIKAEDAVLQERQEALMLHARYIRELFGLHAEMNKDSGNDGRVNWQLTAALSAVLNNFSIITGGPGTGKTTTVAKILAILYTINPALKVALAAPTGKAAVRMAGALSSASVKSLQPSTLHRLLGYIPNSSSFRHNQSNPLNADVIIVDESSMIDAALFAKLLDAVGPDTRLILLGDKDQLASVEAGSLFGDLCQAQHPLNMFTEERAAFINSFIPDLSSHIMMPHISPGSGHPLFQHIIELKHSHRFNAQKGIGKFSKAVIENNRDILQAFIAPGAADEQIWIDPVYSPQLFEEFADGYADFIGEKDIRAALQKMNRLRVLCAVREGEQGVYSVNRRIERYLEQKKLIRPNSEFYENRPVIITSNNYTVGLYNGDTGIVRADEKGVPKVWFDDGEGVKPVLPAYTGRAETVFAMTIHKSQGSEFDKVLVILPADTGMTLLTRELLYTGVTRARLEAGIQATGDVLLTASERFVKRTSGIAARFIKQDLF